MRGVYTVNDTLKPYNQFITPIVEQALAYRHASPEDKLQAIKNKYGLYHGRGKRKRKKKK